MQRGLYFMHRKIHNLNFLEVYLDLILAFFNLQSLSKAMSLQLETISDWSVAENIDHVDCGLQRHIGSAAQRAATQGDLLKGQVSTFLAALVPTILFGAPYFQINLDAFLLLP